MSRPRRLVILNDTPIKLDAPGLSLQARGIAIETRWRAPRSAVARGYRPKALLLVSPSLAFQICPDAIRVAGPVTDLQKLAMLCRSQTLEMLEWLDRRSATYSRRKVGFVYFIEANGFIKIGFSTDTDARLDALQTASATKFNVLHIERGTPALERKLHALFRRYRSHGEWFKKAPEIVDHIAALRCAHV